MRLWERNKYCRSKVVDKGEDENAAATAKFISWSSKSQESSEEVKTGYSLGEDMGERRSEEIDILMVKFLDMLTSGV